MRSFIVLRGGAAAKEEEAVRKERRRSGSERETSFFPLFFERETRDGFGSISFRLSTYLVSHLERNQRLSRRGAIALPGCRLFEEWVSRERDRERERLENNEESIDGEEQQFPGSLRSLARSESFSLSRVNTSAEKTQPRLDQEHRRTLIRSRSLAASIFGS